MKDPKEHLLDILDATPESSVTQRAGGRCSKGMN